MKTFILFIIAIFFYSIVLGQSKSIVKYNLLIGTFTTATNKDGIQVYEFDSQTGDLSYKSKVSDAESPSYLTISRDWKHVYSVNEVKNGSISAYSFDPVSGKLSFINKVTSGGDGPCYVEVDDKNKFAFAANYGSGSLCAIPLNKDGSLGTDIQFIQEEGSSINKSRQSGPHLHSTVLSPDNRFLLTANLGTDKVSTYQFDRNKASKPLTPANPAFISVIAGSGPRHIIFHPDSKHVYLIEEISGSITAFDYENGKLTKKQTITMLSPDFKGIVGAADIHISSDGRFLYGSNRGDANEIVIYAVDQSGRLSYAGRQPVLGKTPRNFVIDPSGNFLLVANQGTNEVVVFKRDVATGLLAPTGKKIEISKPVCLKFAPMK
jgi:6-phosphogluconolactonase